MRCRSLIKFNNYGPEVKSLGAKTLDGRDGTNGVVLPGKPHSFKTKKKETVLVVNGVAKFNGNIVVAGESVTIQARRKCTIQAFSAPIFYHCIYGDEPKTRKMGEFEIVEALQPDGKHRNPNKGRLVEIIMKAGAAYYETFDHVGGNIEGIAKSVVTKENDYMLEDIHSVRLLK